jgi:hypothetical protein
VLALLLALTLHVAGSPTRTATARCQLVIVARVVEGGRQRVCLTSIDGFPAPNVTMHSRGTMAFVLRAGTIRARVRVTQRFRPDGRHAAQTTAGTIVGGTGRYQHARGTLTGSGTVVDTATRLTNVHLTYRLAVRAGA